MLYPKNIEEKLGFDHIRIWLKEECNGEIGRKFVDKIRFSDNIDVIKKLVGQTDEFRRIIQAGEEFPNQNFLDVDDYLHKASIENAFLTEEEFFEVKSSLNTLLQCLRFFANKEEKDFPYLKALCVDIEIDKTLSKSIDQIIDDRGKLRDNASPTLKQIRMQLLAEQSRIRKTLDTILRNLKGQSLVADDANLTIREGRMVIPLAAENKRRIKGFIHDTSASGQTVFIEPEEVLDINNTIRELEAAERHEIIRILTELTAKIRPHVPALKKGYFFLGIIDFIRAKARFGLKIKANKPDIQPKPIIQWDDARHTVLLYNFQKVGKTVVPLSLRLDDRQRILLISGPNAGGKSVALKTVGLTQYMFQCGLLIPVAEGAKAGVFDRIFIDIGDEQSIENDLSTYSSHLKNMKFFTQYGNNKTLCLIDEFGTGTDPQFGGAIAEAVLESLHKQQIFAVITTHYMNLKLFAQNNHGVINGAMRFDTKNLEPLFQLEVGKPGSSFALEIAQKIGLSKEIVGSAKEKLGKDKTDMEKLLKDLEIEKKYFKERNKVLEEEQAHVQHLKNEYEKLKEFLANNRTKLLNEAKEEAKNLVKDANKKIEETIRLIKESEADKGFVKEVRKELEEFKQTLKPETPVVVHTKKKDDDDEIEIIGGEIKEGDYVKVTDTNAVGQVVSLNKKDVTVMIGELKANVRLNRLVKINRKEFRQKDIVIQQRLGGIDINEKMANFTFEIDVRGNRVEEALPRIDSFVDTAIMLNYNELRILHGKGDGILRQVIREHLRRYKQVRSMQDEHVERGGAGITVVQLG